MAVSENELIVPSLYLLSNTPEGLTTTELMRDLREIVALDDDDRRPLRHRNDDHFSQKVRNLVSHRTLIRLSYATFHNGQFKITKEGLEYLDETENQELVEQFQGTDLEGDESLRLISDLSSDDFNQSDQDTLDIYPNVALNIDRQQFSVFELKRKKEKGQLILDPNFQRNEVWKSGQKAELIESLLMNIPLPFIYLNENRQGNLVVIDGRQRLTALFDFLDNKFNLGKDLKILKNIGNKRFIELDPLQQGTIEDFQLVTYVIKPPTSDRVMIDIFDRVNRGGTKLNNQEIRNALYQGNSTILLQSLSESAIFLEATGRSIRTDRMKDKYIILRGLSFYLWKTKESRANPSLLSDYKGDTEEFLANYMQYMNAMDGDALTCLGNTFLKAVAGAHKLLGQNVFRLPAKNNSTIKKPINMALFEATVYLFTDLDFDKNKESLIASYHSLLEEIEFIQSFLSIDSTVKYRFSKMDEIKNSLR